MQFLKHFLIRGLAIVVVNTIIFIPIFFTLGRFVIINAILWALAIDYLIVACLALLVVFVVEPRLQNIMKKHFVEHGVNLFLLVASAVVLWSSIWVSPNQGECRLAINAGFGEIGPNCHLNGQFFFDLLFGQGSSYARAKLIQSCTNISHHSLMSEPLCHQHVPSDGLASLCPPRLSLRSNPPIRHLQDSCQHRGIQRNLGRNIRRPIRLNPSSPIRQPIHPLLAYHRSNPPPLLSKPVSRLSKIILLHLEISAVAILRFLHTLSLLPAARSLLHCSKSKSPYPQTKASISIQSVIGIWQPTTLLLRSPSTLPRLLVRACTEIGPGEADAGLGE